MQGQKILERYEIREEIGKGGRGVVYLAEDILLGRDVAVKILLPDAVAGSEKERFRYEARTTARLSHPSIAPIYDFGDHNGELFIVMPVIGGQTLRVLIDEGPLSVAKIVEIAIQVADALDHSHAQCVIHRDVKPENIMVEWRRRRPAQVKVLDFGLATDSRAAPSADVSTIYGTVLYVSPEQLLGEEIDPRADIYSLGVVLYESLLGQHPLKEGDRSIFQRILLTKPKSLRAHGVAISGELDRLIMSCLEKERDQRPQSARQVRRALMKLHLEDREAGGRRGVRRRARASRVEDEPVSFADRLGDLLLVRGEYLEAEEAYRQAREKRRSVEGSLTAEVEARYLLKLGQLALKLGRYQEARERCQAGIELTASGHPLLATELASLAGLESCMVGDFDRAAEWLQRGRQYLQQAEVMDRDVRLTKVVLLRTEGNLLVGRRQTRKARAVYQRGLTLAEELEDRWECSIALFNIGEAYLEEGDDRSAAQYLEQAIAKKATIGDRWGLAYAHHALAQLYLGRSALTEALTEAQAGMRLAIEVGDPKIIARLELIQGRICLEQGHLDRATGHFRMALQEAERVSAQPEVEQARKGFEAVWVWLGLGGVSGGAAVDSEWN